MKKLLITEVDRGKTFEIQLGNLIVIQLPENPTTGFRWKVQEINSQLLSVQRSNYSISSDSGVGGGGTRTFVLTTLREGFTKVVLKLSQEWEPQTSANSFEVVIVINKLSY
jgi:inhibitor of cysteine peptidase